MKVTVEAEPYASPLFMTYSAILDEMVPLTSDRLIQLIKVEQAYGRLVEKLREAKIVHDNSVADWGGTLRNWD